MAVTSPLPWVRGSPHARKRGEQGSGPGLLGAGLVLRAPGQCSLSRSVLPHRMLGGKCVCSPDLAKATPRPPTGQRLCLRHRRTVPGTHPVLSDGQVSLAQKGPAALMATLTSAKRWAFWGLAVLWTA